jgi:hypothetical protein
MNRSAARINCEGASRDEADLLESGKSADVSKFNELGQVRHVDDLRSTQDIPERWHVLRTQRLFAPAPLLCKSLAMANYSMPE